VELYFLILNLGTRWRLVASLTLRLLYLWGNAPVTVSRIAVNPRTGLDAMAKRTILDPAENGSLLFRTQSVSILLILKLCIFVFRSLYSLFLPLSGSCVSEPLCERIVVYLQLRNLQRRQGVQKVPLY
jgi:hypothetical protein